MLTSSACSCQHVPTASASANADSSSATGKSFPTAFAQYVRTRTPPNAPISAPTNPKIAPPATGSITACAASAPTSPPNTIRTVSPTGAVRLGVDGSVSATYSPSAASVNTINDTRLPTQNAHPCCGNSCSHANQHNTAIAVIDRSPTVIPSNTNESTKPDPFLLRALLVCLYTLSSTLHTLLSMCLHHLLRKLVQP